MASETPISLEMEEKVDAVVSTTAWRDNSRKNTPEEEDSNRGAEYGTFNSDVKDSNPATDTSAQSSDDDSQNSAASRTYIYIYCSHFLSAWGDRMWTFGVGLFLVAIAGNYLQLPAIYGLASGLAIFMLGAPLGDWVDSTPRLKAAQLSLVAQNILVMLCACGVYFFLHLEDAVHAVPGNWLVPLCHIAVILTAMLADMASVARVIAVERDWIVKICDTDTDMLAKMTATLRRIDQMTLIMAPIATGEVMTSAGLKNGALFIGVWNLCSVTVEYYLMWKVYTTVPALALKGTDVLRDEKPSADENTTDGCTTSGSIIDSEASGFTCEDDKQTLVVRNDDTASRRNEEKAPGCCSRCRTTCFGRISDKFVASYEGWKAFMRYSVSLAGLALACLFMTVLGFDNITVAYSVTQGLSEAVLGILMAASAVFGMLGTFVYPLLRRRIGLVRTGMLSLSLQVMCLSLCVVSVWMPGSPFDPTYSRLHADTASVQNITTAPSKNYSSLFQSPGIGDSEPCDYTSVIFLMTGIVLSRFVLYMADLSIIQLFLEAVLEGERGVVNGVQNSLNRLMEVLKFLLVVFVPDTESFGFLVIVSFTFVMLAWILYAIFLKRDRGHFTNCPRSRADASYSQF